MKIRNAYKKADGFMLVETFDHGKQIWTAGKSRTRLLCQVCKVRYSPGDVMFRPKTNGQNRMERCCVGCMDDAAVERTEEVARLNEH